MSAATTIEWTDRTWNPTRGCSLVSHGCTNCYAMKQAHRFSGQGKPYEGLTRLGHSGPTWTGKVRLVPEALDQPRSWRNPSRVFVNSMSDLFHEGLANEDIAAVFGVMAACPQHTFQILTKRPDRMQAWFRWVESQRGPLTVELVKQGGAWPRPDSMSAQALLCLYFAAEQHSVDIAPGTFAGWPLPNVWLGVSVEDQATADERIPLLLQTPAAVRFVSYEPALGPVDFSAYLDGSTRWSLATGATKLDWLIVGGESGTKARPCDVEWLRSAVRQCRAAGVACFVKQLGAYPVLRHGQTDRQSLHSSGYPLSDRKGGDWSEWPLDLRVRKFPE
jgi:protein gp37